MAKERSLAEAVSELKRELGIRRRCYSRWIADGKLSDVDAEDRLERMEKALGIVERAEELSHVPELPSRQGPVGLSVPSSTSVERTPIGID